MAWGVLDCNNFFASCERIFRPDWEGRPLVVLSNNDGCVVARSNEAKQLGIGMGVPVFKVRDLLKKHKVVVRSGNFRLYGDISNRVMGVVRRHCARVQVYSIDEAFVEMPDDVEAALAVARVIRDDIYRCVGMPVSVGVAPTKVLSKLAVQVAKGRGEKAFYLGTDDASRALMDKISVGEVWGVGRRLTMAMMARGIMTAGDLRRQDAREMRRRFTVSGERLVLELQGVDCRSHDEVEEEGQGAYMSTRGFGRAVRLLEEVEEAVAMHAGHAAKKLRADKQVCRMVMVMLRTSPHGLSEPYWRKSHTVGLLVAGSDTRTITRAALHGIRQIFEVGRSYQKCGVMLMEICPKAQANLGLFGGGDTESGEALMAALDGINAKFGRGSVRLGAEGFDRSWQAKSGLLSPCYTTDWEQLAVVK